MHTAADELAALKVKTVNADPTITRPKYDLGTFTDRLTSNQVALLCRCSAMSVGRWVKEGKLPYTKIGGRYYFKYEDAFKMISTGN